MYEQTSKSPFRKYTTDQTSDEVLNRAFEWRKGSEDVSHTVMRFQYHEPFKGRVHYDTLTCADGEELYRITIDGQPLLWEDEEEFGGWMTYPQLLCWFEGYRRLSEFEDFLRKDASEE